METESRDFKEIKDKYFMVFVPAPVMNIPRLFNSPEEAKRYFLSEVHHQPQAHLDQYKEIEKDIADSGGALMILNIEQEVQSYEKEHRYGGENFKDRQHFIDVIVFGDPED